MVCMHDTALALARAKAGPATQHHEQKWKYHPEQNAVNWAVRTSLPDDGTKTLYSPLKYPGRGLRSRYVRGFEVVDRGVSHEWREAVSNCGIVCCLSRLCSNWCWASGSRIPTLFQHTRISCVKFTLDESASRAQSQGCMLECSSRTCAWRVYILRDHNVMWRQYAIGPLHHCRRACWCLCTWLVGKPGCSGSSLVNQPLLRLFFFTMAGEGLVTYE